MMQKRYIYFTVGNDHYFVNMEGTYINREMRIGNREPRTSSLFLFGRTTPMFKNCRSATRSQFPGR